MTDSTPPPGPAQSEPSGPIHHTGTFPAVTGQPGHHTGTFPAVAGQSTGMVPVLAAPVRPRGSTALALTLSMLGTALLMVIVGVIWFGTSGGPGGQRGAWNGPIAFPEGMTTATSHAVTFAGDTVYFRSGTSDNKTWITAADAKTGAKKWSLEEGLDTGDDTALTYIDPGRDAILVKTTTGGDEQGYLVEAKTGKARPLSASEGAPMYYRMIGGVPVRTGVGGGLEVLDGTGGNLWENKEADTSTENMVAMATSDDLGDLPYPGNPIDAEQLLSVGYDGTVTIFKTTTGEVVTEEESAVAEGSTVLLVLDDVLYAKTSNEDRTRDTITAYDIKDGFDETDSWKGEKGQSFTGLTPCGGKRICASGYWPGESSRLGNAVIDIDEGIVWQAPEDTGSSYAYLSFAGDTMAVAYFSDYVANSPTETQLYDRDFEETGEPIPGWFQAVDDKTFAAVSSPQEYQTEVKAYDAEVSIIDAKDGRVSRLDTYPAYPGCGIGKAILACPTETGYRVWPYR